MHRLVQGLFVVIINVYFEGHGHELRQNEPVNLFGQFEEYALEERFSQLILSFLEDIG